MGYSTPFTPDYTERCRVWCSLASMRIEENKPLAPLTTLGIGGPARWFAEARNEEDITEAATWTREKKIPLFVLGGGSNLLVADAGFNGLVLHIGLKGIRVRESASQSNERIYEVAAGEDWDQFVQRAVDDDCAGLECLAGIPGKVGGTPVQNVGAYGQEVSTTIEFVYAFDLYDRKFVELGAAECGFAYRKSFFNTTDRGRYIVSRVDYRLKQGGAPTLKYADLQRAFEPDARPSLKEMAATVRRIRQSKGMLLVEGDADSHSAGSFFKNPIVNAERVAAVTTVVGTEPPRFAAGPGYEGCVKLPAAWLIEKAGFTKGYVLGGAGISTKHTLALINRGDAAAAEIMALADKIRAAVAQRFGIQLQMEPVLLGFGNS
jgi:UDP-N-acetylmuramate dehydrogenase